MKKSVGKSFGVSGFLLSVFLILLMCFVVAQHNALTTSVNIVEDINSLINVSINDTSLDAAGSIYQINFTLPSGAVYVVGTANTTAANTMTNTSSTNVISFMNSSATPLMTAINSSYFWFNVTAATPGTLNLTVGSVNTTGGYHNTNVTLTVNDTTRPGVTIILPTNTTNSSTINFNLSVSDNAAVSYCLVSINNWVTNYTMTMNASSTGANYTNLSMAQGSFAAKFACNDTSNNWNLTSTVSFDFDNVSSLIEFVSPVNNTQYNDSGVFLNLSYDSDATYVWWSNGTNNFTYTSAIYVYMVNGTYTWYAYANDTTNNKNLTEIPLYFQVQDDTAPDLTLLAPSNVSYTSRNVTLNVSSVSVDIDTWWCSIDGGRNITFAVNGTNYVRSVNTSIDTSDGNSTIFVYVNDSKGHWNFTLVQFQVNTSVAASADDSSTSGSGAQTVTYTLSASNFENGLEVIVSKDQQVRFNVGGTYHHVEFKSYNLADKTITIDVSSEKQTATLKEGEIKKFDVDGDGGYDVSVEFKGFLNVAAKLIVMKASGVVLGSPEDNSSANGSVADDSAAPAGADVGMTAKGKLLWGIVILGIIIIAIVLYLLLKKKSYYKKGY